MTPSKPDVSLLHLYLLRLLFLVIAVFMGAQIWPLVFQHRPWADSMHGIAVAMLAALTVLSLLGVRYPVKMLPLMLFELAWKMIWLISMALPAWMSGDVDEALRENTLACGLGVIVLFVVPWPYVWRTYVAAPGDRWR